MTNRESSRKRKERLGRGRERKKERKEKGRMRDENRRREELVSQGGNVLMCTDLVLDNTKLKTSTMTVTLSQS